MARLLQPHRYLNGTARFALPALGGLLVAALLFGNGGCRRAESGTTAAPALAAPVAVRLQTDWYPQAEHGGFYQALARGFYAEAGLEVTILPGGPGARVSRSVVSGTADIGIHRSDDLVVQIAEGLPFVIVGAFMQRDPQALLLHEDDPVQHFADLDGRTIMAMPGTNWIRYLQRRYQIDFTVVPMNYGFAQFVADRTFIQQCFVTNEPYFVRQQGVRAKTLLLAGSGYDPYRVIFTTRRFLREQPEAVEAFVGASLLGWDDFMTGDPTPGKAAITERNASMTSDFMDYSIETMRRHHLVAGEPARGEWLGRLDRGRLQSQLDLLVDLQIIPTAPPLGDVADFTLSPPTPPAK
jgi:NitT/TauT family transport system substrate-binding protein